MSRLKFPLLLLLLVGAMPAQAELRHVLTSPALDDEFGSAVAAAGDVDGDGAGDIVVGAPFDDVGFTDSGSVHVYSGATGLPLWTFTGDAANQWLGHSVAGVGDVNGDGYCDVLAGMPNESTTAAAAGAARVFSGLDGTVLYTLYGDAARDWFGWAATGIGDVDLDGKDDFAVAAPGRYDELVSPGFVRAFSGATGAVLWTATGPEAGARFGFALAGSGEVTGDGIPDLVVGEILSDSGGFESGQTHVLHGGTGLFHVSFPGDGADERWGHGIGMLGDVDGDGRDDILAASNDRTGAPSRARIRSGMTGAILVDVTGTDGFGHSADGIGDVNGDGTPDFVVGAPADDTAFVNAGAAFIYSGADGSQLAAHYGTAADQRFGYLVSGLADVNQDAFSDVVIGTSFYGPQPGYARVVSVIASEPYGIMPAWATQTLQLEWLPGVPGLRHAGLVRASGGASLGVGIIAVSVFAADGSASFAGVELLVDVAPQSSFLLAFPFNVNGEVVFPLDLRVPGLAGISLFIQVFDADPAAPQGLYGSNGLKALFGA